MLNYICRDGAFVCSIPTPNKQFPPGGVEVGGQERDLESRNVHDSIQTVLRERKQYENSLVWNVHLEQNLATDGNAKSNLDKFNEVYPSRLLDARFVWRLLI